VAERSDVKIPTPDGELAAWLYRPGPSDGEAKACVVLAHGFTGTRDMQLDRAGERLADAGYAALVFDYRHFGDSDGEPRQLLDIKRQYEDWDAAIEYARGIEGIDRNRLVLWGTSFTGGHVVEAAARHSDVAAAIAQVPFMDGLAQLTRTPPRIGARLMADGVRDELRARRGKPPLLIPVTAAERGYAVLNDPHVWESIPAVVPKGSTWRNEVAARIALRLGSHRPIRSASRVRCPLLVQVVEDETVISNRAAARAARLAPRGELSRHPGLNHFDVYTGDGFERVFADQLDFLQRHL
jgi:dienelactone hydrolase